LPQCDGTLGRMSPDGRASGETKRGETLMTQNLTDQPMQALCRKLVQKREEGLSDEEIAAEFEKSGISAEKMQQINAATGKCTSLTEFDARRPYWIPGKIVMHTGTFVAMLGLSALLVMGFFKIGQNNATALKVLGLFAVAFFLFILGHLVQQKSTGAIYVTLVLLPFWTISGLLVAADDERSYGMRVAVFAFSTGCGLLWLRFVYLWWFRKDS
jgi:hypothetical protein